MMIHKPVLLEEVVENLNLKPGIIAVDGTLGAGGHSIAILKKILPSGKLISIDWDKTAVEEFRKNKGIQKFVLKGELILVSDNYVNLEKILGEIGIETADAIFVDLGFSSDQIEDEKRGFSFLKNGPLDMRYSPETQEKTAADIVNRYSEKDLADVFWKYGEEKYARKIAKGIIQARKIGKIEETGKLVGVISKSISKAVRPRDQRRMRTNRRRIHCATKVFQALRIEVNQEFSNLKKFLDQSLEVLASGGRLAVISFHSLEDRIVKNFFQKESRDCICPPNFPKCVCVHKKRLKIVTKKPIGPGKKEIRENPRARSAKLRVAEKI